MKNNAGLTFIELLLVVLIIGTLAVFALPRFLGFSDDAEFAAEQGDVVAVRSGISIYRNESMAMGRSPAFPPTLDPAAPGPASSGSPLFASVLAQGISDGRWTKVSPTRYTSPLDKSYLYDPEAGTFLESTAQLTPLGSTFTEISGNIISLVQDYFDSHGSWPRSWGDYKYTDLGLDPAVWNGVPYEGIIYGTGGNRISIEPDEGWRLTVTGLDGNVRVLTSSLNWNLWYDMNTSNWYYHSITPEEAIDISTLQITPP